MGVKGSERLFRLMTPTRQIHQFIHSFILSGSSSIRAINRRSSSKLSFSLPKHFFSRSITSNYRMSAEVVDQSIEFVDQRVVPFDSVIDQQWVIVRVLVEETRRTKSGPLVLEERKVATVERDALVWGRDPSIFHSVASNMVHTIPSILLENRASVAAQMSDYINTTFLQPHYYFLLTAGLQFTYHIHLHTTHHFDEFDFLGDAFLHVGDEFFRLELQQQQQQEDEDDHDEPPTTIEFESLPSKSYTASASNDDDGGGCCAVCLENLVEGAKVSELPCSHTFHTDCILPWLNRKTSCPTCRFQISSSS